MPTLPAMTVRSPEAAIRGLSACSPTACSIEEEP